MAPWLLACVVASSKGPWLLRTAVAPRACISLASEKDTRPRGFGPTDGEREARVLKKLDSLRSEEQVNRMASERERLETEQMIQEEGLNVVPEVVGDRMMKRMLGFLAVPVALGILAFLGFVLASRQFDTTIRPTTVAITTQAIFALGIVGITYGPLSASWDEDREGTLLGIDEAKKNVETLFSRGRKP